MAVNKNINLDFDLDAAANAINGEPEVIPKVESSVFGLPGAKKTKQFSIELPEDLYSDLKRISKKNNLTMSKLIRFWLSQAVKNQ